VLVLTTTGRRSGKKHATPVLCHRDCDGSLLVIAVNGAADWNPDWFGNLVADPHVEIDFEGAHRLAHALVLDGDDRADTWAAAASAFPGLDAAQREAQRIIPLIRLTIE